MDYFTSALISKYTTKIPPEFDWFAPLIGDWDLAITTIKMVFAGIFRGNGSFAGS